MAGHPDREMNAARFIGQNDARRNSLTGKGRLSSAFIQNGLSGTAVNSYSGDSFQFSAWVWQP